MCVLKLFESCDARTTLPQIGLTRPIGVARQGHTPNTFTHLENSWGVCPRGWNCQIQNLIYVNNISALSLNIASLPTLCTERKAPVLKILHALEFLLSLCWFNIPRLSDYKFARRCQNLTLVLRTRIIIPLIHYLTWYYFFIDEISVI